MVIAFVLMIFGVHFISKLKMHLFGYHRKYEYKYFYDLNIINSP